MFHSLSGHAAAASLACRLRAALGSNSSTAATASHDTQSDSLSEPSASFEILSGKINSAMTLSLQPSLPEERLPQHGARSEIPSVPVPSATAKQRHGCPPALERSREEHAGAHGVPVNVQIVLIFQPRHKKQ